MFTTYQDTISFLFSQLPMYQKIGQSAFKKDLTNITKLCENLVHPQNNFPCIHIAGTNGKGSVSHILGSVLIEAGYKVGIYTSPHYKDFRERIKINNQLIEKQAVINFVNQNKNLFNIISPSFFEITVAMMFDYFNKEKVDIAVIETGLGGRLDSTNIIHPILSIITNISMDHQSMLGDTIEKIAFEKAGIIKPNTPVVIGEYVRDSKKVFDEVASERNSPIFYAQSEILIEESKRMMEGQSIQFYHLNTKKETTYHTDLMGDYQQNNLRTTLLSLHQLKKLNQNKNNSINLNISSQHIKNGFKNIKNNTYFIGRWQKIDENPLTIVDSAHNEAGIRELVKQIELLKFNDLHIVFGMVNDKSADLILPILPKDAIYYFCKANIPRGKDAKILQKEAEKYNLKGKVADSVKLALKTAKFSAQKDDLIIVAGSVFVVAEVI